MLFLRSQKNIAEGSHCILQVYNSPADAARFTKLLFCCCCFYFTMKWSPVCYLDCAFLKSDSNHHEKNISHSFRWPFWICIFLYLDIDECQTLVPGRCSCGVHGEPCGATCTNTVPSYFCTCAKGFQLRSGGTICDGNLFGFEFKWSRLNTILKILKHRNSSQRRIPITNGSLDFSFIDLYFSETVFRQSWACISV